ALVFAFTDTCVSTTLRKLRPPAELLDFLFGDHLMTVVDRPPAQTDGVHDFRWEGLLVLQLRLRIIRGERSQVAIGWLVAEQVSQLMQGRGGEIIDPLLSSSFSARLVLT